MTNTVPVPPEKRVEEDPRPLRRPALRRGDPAHPLRRIDQLAVRLTGGKRPVAAEMQRAQRIPDSATQMSMMEEFHLGLARHLRENDKPPTTRAAWARRRMELLAATRAAAGERRRGAGRFRRASWGDSERPEVRFERLTFELRPGVAVTANAYIPAEGKGRLPAVLCPHGHWPLARIDPVVQARCFGLARLGYFVLTLDAFGSGERGTTPGVADTTVGCWAPRSGRRALRSGGCSFWDNVRALDYLCTRPGGTSQRIGCTGASGGGNQAMYVSAFDARIRAAAPVCSVGTFELTSVLPAASMRSSPARSRWPKRVRSWNSSRRARCS